MISKETVQAAKDKPLADVIKSFGFQNIGFSRLAYCFFFASRRVN